MRHWQHWAQSYRKDSPSNRLSSSSIQDALGERGEAGEQGVTFILLGLPEFGVGAVESIKHTEDPKTLVEPGTRKDEHGLTLHPPHQGYNFSASFRVLSQ